MVLVLAMSLEQAKVVFSYALAFLRESPVLRKEIAETTRSEIRLKNGIVRPGGRGLHAKPLAQI